MPGLGLDGSVFMLEGEMEKTSKELTTMRKGLSDGNDR